MRLFALALFVIASLLADPAFAVNRYVDTTTSGTCSTPSDTDYDPITETCGSGTAPVYNSISAGVTAMVSGDDLYIMAGTYTGSSSMIYNVVAGTAAKHSAIHGDPGDSPTCSMSGTCSTVLSPSGTWGIEPLNSYVDITGMKVTSLNLTSYPMILGSETADVVGLRVWNMDISATGADTLGGSGATGIMVRARTSDSLIEGNNIHHNGSGGSGLAIYCQGDRITVRGNWMHHNRYYGFQTYNSSANSGGETDHNIIEYNLIEDNNVGAIALGGKDHIVRGNVIKGAFAGGFDGGNARSVIVNNIFTLAGLGLGTGSLNIDMVVQNNIIWGSVTGGGAGTVISYNACRSADGCGSNKTTYAALTDLVVSSTNYSLKEGSAAINAGTAVAGKTCNGACDLGPYETYVVSSGGASITGNTMEVVIDTMAYGPIEPTLSGWSVNCSGSGCGTTAIASVSRKTGATTTVSIIVSGLSGGSCAVGQTWTVTYASASGATVDTHPLANKQELTGFSGLAVTNNCSVGGVSLPGTPYIIYEFDENLNDTSGNNLHATGNGITYADSKFWRGMKTDAGQDDYAEIPYFSGVNPTAQSLTIAGGFYVDAADVCGTRGIGGAGTGTNQRFHLYYNGCSFRLGVQTNGGGTPTEFSPTPGWNHVCVNFDAATDTATLFINGTEGQIVGASVQPYTSFLFAGNFRIGRFVGSSLGSGPNHIYERWVVWQAVVSCPQVFQNFEAPVSAWTGNLAIVSTRIYGAKTDSASALIPLGAIDADVTLPPGAAFTYAAQMDCTTANCTPIGRRLYYTCAACVSAGTELPVPPTAGQDGIEFWSGVSEVGLLSGAHGANLSGALTHVNGTTNRLATDTPIIDLNTNNSTVQRYQLRIVAGTPIGRTFRFFEREQSGVALNGYVPASGLGVTVGSPTANAGP